MTNRGSPLDLGILTVFTAGQSTVEVKTESPRHDISDVVADAAGFLGLLLGVSAIGTFETLVEVISGGWKRLSSLRIV